MGGWTDLSCCDLLQMVGRAGRQGLDTKGTAIVMVKEGQGVKYSDFVNGLAKVNSQLASEMPESVLRAIHGGTIRDSTSCLQCLRQTFW